MLLKRIYFICLLLGTLLLFVLAALSLSQVSETQNSSLSIPEVFYVFQIVLYSYFVIMLVLSNIMYFSLSKTIYLLIFLVIFLVFLNFDWVVIKQKYWLAIFFSFGAIMLIIMNYYVLRNYFKPIKDKEA